MKQYGELLGGAICSACIAVFVALAAGGYIWQGCQ